MAVIKETHMGNMDFIIPWQQVLKTLSLCKVSFFLTAICKFLEL